MEEDLLKKYSIGRVAVFVDAANILYSQQTLGWEIDYEKLSTYVKEQTACVGIYFYSGVIAKNKNQQKFFAKMRSFGYEVTTKEVKWIKDKNSKVLKGKGNLDIELALDVSQKIALYDTLILLSGDSDFAPLIDFVRSKGKKAIVISTKYHVSKEIIKSSNKYINLKHLRKNIERK